jgi:hypothetical protein
MSPRGIKRSRIPLKMLINPVINPKAIIMIAMVARNIN